MMSTFVKKITKYGKDTLAKQEHKAASKEESSRKTAPMPQPFQDPCTQLQRLMHEAETMRLQQSPGNFCVVLRPTERAILARHGYILSKTIGSGNYSKVKLAKDVLGISGQVAVKIINCSSAPRDFLTRFLPRELEIWNKIQHPNIIR